MNRMGIVLLGLVLCAISIYIAARSAEHLGHGRKGILLLLGALVLAMLGAVIFTGGLLAKH